MHRFGLMVGILSVSCAVIVSDASAVSGASVPAKPGAAQAAIDKAPNGGVVFLETGDHAGCLTIDHPITLTGAEGALVSGCGHGSVVKVAAADVTVRGLTITGSGSSAEHRDSGVRLAPTARRAVVDSNRIIGNLVGVDIHGAPDAVVIGNVIEGRRGHRMNDRGNGVYVWNAPGSRVENNDIRWGRDGIFVNTSTRNVFAGNHLRDLRFAVHSMYANDSDFRANVSTGNHLGYAIMFSKRVTIRDNVSDHDRDHGLMLNYTNDSMVIGNQITATAGKCVFIYNAHKNRLTGNRFQGCAIGIHFTAGSERNSIFGNDFIANREQVKYVGSREIEWSTNGRGNFWSDHVAYDLDGDGLAETVYRPNDVIDRVLWKQPLAKLLLGSPAIQLVRWSQSLFPAFYPGGVIDSHPLMKPEVRSPTPPQGNKL